ncbi:integrin alpha-PS4-like isoform X2 [Diorhabda carinulata]|uniref:integrin alpha-PS4-like isoform X2 n=1 Tax=Diorhabda carinulata TaxID=1163345 RepID=UPI0025A23A37|nr:integrin alpha-PS4-like isoform X2 [Diorhabda carinulata]
MKLSIFLLLFFSKSVYCFNLDVDFPIIFQESVPTNEKTYFGYTVAIYPGKPYGNEWIRIGAPKGNDSRYKTIENPGTVHSCQILSGCSLILFPHSVHKPIENWKGGFIGGSMDVSYKFQKNVVCGFRQYYNKDGDYRTMGSCYWSYLNSSTFEKIEELLDQDKAIGNNFYLYGQGEAGFSVHFPERENELILGAPGIYNWGGTPFRVTDYTYNIPDSSRRKRIIKKRGGQNTEIFKTVEIPYAGQNVAFGLFGYSVTSGYYYGKGKLYYASSSPRGVYYRGQVVVFQFNEDNKIINTKETKAGQQFGEYFGACLASGDLNNDNFDDLLVGAPYYKGNLYNEGRVYVFLGAQNLRQPIILNGEYVNGQFGTAIMFLGDLNMDGYGEVAIGSPYEDGATGNVYIYKGSVDGLETKLYQKIRGRDIYKDLLGFGITISRAVDMDGNKFRDFAIGSHLSGHAVLIRSKPIIAIKYTFTTTPNMLHESTRIFYMNICFSYSLYEGDFVGINYTITVDERLGRASIGPDKTISDNLIIESINSEECRNISTTIVNPTTLDIKTPIQVFIRYVLDSPPIKKTVVFAPSTEDDGFCVTCPILDESKSNSTSFETEIPFILDCGSDNECISELKVHIEFPELRNNTLVIGSKQYLKMKTIVENLGENAYSTKLGIVLPNFLYFRETPPRCISVNASAIRCDVANPLKKNTDKSVDFILDITNLDQELYLDRIGVHFEVLTTSINKNNNSMKYFLALSSEADVTIYGKIEQETNYYGSSSLMASLLTHTYKIEKFGVSPLNSIKVKVQVPYKYQTKEKKIQFLTISPIEAFFAGQPLPCNISEEKEALGELGLLKRRRRQVEIFKSITESNKKEDIKINEKEITITTNKTLYLNCTTDEVTCFDVVCTFGPYTRKNNPASISFYMNVNITHLIDMAKHKDAVLISTNGEVIIDSPERFIQNGNRSDTTILSSILINDDTKEIEVALWVIIISVIIGLILLMILILVLIKAGFFKRSKKEELENLKAAANQEAKILEIIDYSNSPDDELDPTQDQNEEIGQPIFPEQTTSSQEQLVDN